ncbi:MAG: lytic transglycosylase domain-containing protein [Bacteroidetes bacterium]|nr:lytic transglycosylase domain-containing protein [Bacteroidota bacterium]
MIKKQLITCSVISLLLIISGFSVSAKMYKPKPKKVNKLNAGYRFIFTEKNLADDASFADEPIPVNDARIDHKLRHSVFTISHTQTETMILQREAASLFPIIEPILKMYGIPDDFKYIPLVEAGLKSGVSKRGAAGWWQFMPGTARTYGLKVGNGRDDRYSIRKSTVAACKYIKELYAEFNSWTLAAAAYNNGEIQLARAIRNQSEDNYFRLHLNPETGAYVYRIIAMKKIVDQPQQLGFKYYCNTNLQPAELMVYN